MKTPKSRVGILGGGQLAMMLAESAERLGVHVTAQTEETEAPVRHTCKDVRLAQLDLFSQCDVVVFENEFIDCEKLRKLSQGTSVRFAPSLEVIERFQDKLKQKKFLQAHGIPTSPFVELKNEELPVDLLANLARYVLKWSRLGYDGKGVHLGRETGAAKDFVKKASERGVEVYAEERVSFSRELAIVAVQSVTGEFACYPLVVSEQASGICKRVMGPARVLGISEELEKQAQEIARKIGAESNLVGAFAIEFFETPQGLMVNEIAPRVHNSGHYTQDASPSSQFENHLRAALGMKLGDTTTSPAFAMLNLLGPQGISAPGTEPKLPLEKNFHLHWYFKSETRPGRKVGHINVTCSTASQLKQALASLADLDQTWTESL